MRPHPLSIALVALLSASACGGSPLDDWSEESAELEDEVLDLINVHRAEGALCGGAAHDPVPPLQSNALLRDAARLHSHDMAERDYFSHDNPDGEGPAERISATGYSGRTWGENILRGASSAEGAVTGWMNSTDHCRNIMRESFEDVGIGHHERHWTMKFAAPR